MKHIRTSSLVLATAVIAQAAHAQLPEASAAGFSMAGNYSAVARGFDAIAFNPANLALGKPRPFSLSVLAGNVNSGINPIRFSDFKANGDNVVPAATRESWLQQIGTGRETGGTDAGLSLVAMTIRNFGMQAGLSGTGEVNLNQDAAEALLFGNAGRTGSAKSFNFNGSDANGSLFGVGAMSYAIPLESDARGGQFTFGITAKYIRGIVAARAADHGSTTTPEQINVEFPLIYTDSTHIGNAGSGYGVDLGMSWEKDGTTYSITARNVVNTFAWSTAAFTSRRDGFSFDGKNNVSDFDAAPYGSAPAEMRSAFEAERFKPELVTGAANRSGDLLVSMDFIKRLGDGIATGPRSSVGVGAEYTGIKLLALRAGGAKITDGYQGAAGVGLRLGAFEMSAGAMKRSKGGRSENGFVLNLFSLQ